MKIKRLHRDKLDTEKWDACINHAENCLIYGYAWYLDACCNRQWEGLVAGDYEAVMPLPFNRKILGLKQIYQPVLCQQLGVFGNNLNTELLNDFLGFRKGFIRFYQQLNACNKELIAGLNDKQNLILDLNDSYDNLFGNYHKVLRKKVRKYKALLSVKKGGSISELIGFYTTHLKSKIAVSETTQSQIHEVLTEVLLRKKGYITQVTLGDQVLAQAIILKDQNRLYNVFGASSVTGKEQCAMHVLLDSVIEEHACSNFILDFEGSEIPGIASFFKSFGAIEQPYASIQRKLL